MTEVQNKLLDMFSFFHDLCEKEGLRYYALGGTALGAARHNGFIPWDDDIDVGMPRLDYERLKALSKQMDMGIYRFEYPGEKYDFVYPYGKLYDTTTTLVENTRFSTKRGVYIDVFPLDGAGNTYEESLVHLQKIDSLVNLLCTRVCAVRKGRKWYKNALIILMQLVPDSLIGQKKLMDKIEKLSKKKEFDRFDYVANFVGNWHEKEIVKREFLGIPVEHAFERITVMIPENVDGFLTSIYGDWRKLPPADKRVSHHDYLSIDLNSSYLDN